MELNRNFFLVIFFVFTSVVFAQGYPTRAYLVGEGLASSTIHDITQDNHGIMWFATASGVSSYDGYKWTNYNEKNGLPFREYYRILADRKDNVWVFTTQLNDGILYYDHNAKKWHHFPCPIITSGRPISGKIAIVGIAIIDSEEMTSPVIAIGTVGYGCFFYSGQQSFSFSYHQRVAENAEKIVYSVKTFQDKFLIATYEGLFQVDPRFPEKWEPLDIKTPHPAVYSISIDESFSPRTEPTEPPPIWLSGEKWIGYYHRGTFHLVYQGKFPRLKYQYQYRGVKILADGFGGVWGGDRYVIFNLDSHGNLKVIRLQTPFFSDGAYAMFKDRERNLWVSNFRGAFKVSHFHFENYDRKDNLYDDEVTAIVELSDGTILFAHSGGFSYLTEKGVEILKIPGYTVRNKIDYRVLDMCQDNQGNVWAAVNRPGILKITPSRQFKWYQEFRDKESTVDTIRFSAIMKDKNGDIWSVYNTTLLKYDIHKDAFSPAPMAPPLSQAIRRIFEGKNDTLLLATYNNGLIQYDQGRISFFKSPDHREANQTYSAFYSEDGRILVGTAAGLFILQDDQLVPFQDEELEIRIPVYFITQDSIDQLWFGLSNGVIRWDGKKAHHYTINQGLAGRETNRAAGITDSKGRVWIGTDMGASCYNREREIVNRPPPLVELISIDASGSIYQVDKSISLPYEKNDLVFYFRGISLIDENAISYNLKLEGFDSQWTTHYTTTTHNIRYTNIPAGQYRFHVRAVNASHIESEEITSPLITVKQPFVRSIEFYIIILFFLFGIMWLMSSTIARKRQTVYLEDEVVKRTKQLAESQDELRNIFDSAHDAIIIMHPETEVVLEANQRAFEMYGYPRSEFVGMSLKKISRNVPQGEEKILETIKSGRCQRFESSQYRKDGTCIFLELNATVIHYQGQSAILSINRDISERKAAEMQIQKSLEEKTILLKEIHHRVKNNLQIISSLLDLQSDSIENEEILRVFRESKNRIHSMAMVHENIYQSEDLASIDVVDYIQQLFGYFLNIYSDVGTRITSSVDTTIETLDMNHAVPIGLILTELITNALKYAFPSPNTGEIRIYLFPETDNRLILTVSDNGTGLPEAIDIEKTDTLGLQLVYLLTKQLGGEISIQRTGGTVFKIIFPYRA